MGILSNLACSLSSLGQSLKLGTKMILNRFYLFVGAIAILVIGCTSNTSGNASMDAQSSAEAPITISQSRGEATSEAIETSQTNFPTPTPEKTATENSPILEATPIVSATVIVSATQPVSSSSIIIRKEQISVSQGINERVNRASNGSQAFDPGIPPDASVPSLSADGRYVAFASSAADLVNNDTNGFYDVFVHDRQTGEIERVSIGSNGSQAEGDSFSPTISADGRFVAFQSANLWIEGQMHSGIFVHDRQTGDTEFISISNEGEAANGISHNATISADGQFVAFVSEATNLVTEDTNDWLDIFVYDRQAGQIERVNVSVNGQQSNGWSHHPDISADGRFVVYVSEATNLVPEDGGVTSIFVYDRLTGEVERIGDGARAYISHDGHWLAVENHPESYIYDRQTGTTQYLQIPWAILGDISADGRYLVFTTSGDAQIVLYDRETDQTKLISVALDGMPSYGFAPSLSADGKVVSFISIMDNLVADDTNGGFDVFVHERSD